MYRHTVFSCLLVLLLLGAKALDASDALVQQAIAGLDARLAKVRHGRAVYDISYRRFDDPDGSKPFSVEIIFDGENTRWSVDGATLISDGTRTISLADDVAKSSNPLDVVAIVKDTPFAASHPNDFHPRFLGLREENIRKGLLTDLIRERHESNAGVSAKTVPDNQIQLECELASGRNTLMLRINSADGYAVSHIAASSKKYSEVPFFEWSAEYRDVGDGQFVVAHSSAVERELVDGRYGNGIITEMNLAEIDLSYKPDPKLFSIESFEMPVGARIWDKRTGETSLYGIGKVSNAEIREYAKALAHKRQTPPGSRHSALLYWALAIANVIILTGAGYTLWKKRVAG